jgi:hypothetical protein
VAKGPGYYLKESGYGKEEEEAEPTTKADQGQAPARFICPCSQRAAKDSGIAIAADEHRHS